MKSKFIVLALLAVFNCLFLRLSLAAEIEVPKAQAINQVLASNNVQAVIGIVPEIEKLWPQEPKSYFESVQKAAGILGAASTNIGAKSALAWLLASLVEKPFSGTPEADVLCLEGKKAAVLYFLNFDDIRESRTNLLAIAKCVGKIREQMVSGFVPKTVYLNPPGLMDATPEQAKQIIGENERNKAVNNFQKLLRSADGVLVFHLLHNAAQFPASNPANTDFIRQIAKLGHLTAEEQRQLMQ